MPLSALSTLGTRGAAGVLVVRVDAEPGLDHHHTVGMFVPAVLVCEQGLGLGVEEGEVSLEKKKPTCPVSAHANLMVADRREPSCRFAPGPVWCRGGSRSCAFCPPSDTAPPSSVSLCHKTVSTGREKREGVSNGSHCSSRPRELSDPSALFSPRSTLW